MKAENKKTKKEKKNKKNISEATVKKSSIPEGDGEEIFNEMLSDLISFADMVERMEEIVTDVSAGRMCPLIGRAMAEDMLDDVSEALVKWATYQEPTA